MENYFKTLNEINVNGKTEKKNGLTYLSWAWAWGETKKLFPDANYTVYQNDAMGGMPYFTDGKTCMVKVGVTVNGIEHIEFLPVMDHRNASIPMDKVTSFDINKAIQRCLTKAVARHGLGLYIYAGEDLPEEETGKPAEVPKPANAAVPKQETPKPDDHKYRCEMCGQTWTPYRNKKGDLVGLLEHEMWSKAQYKGRVFCPDCCRQLDASKKKETA